ncbi:NAD(P)H-binding protein [Modestobacter versicolor]|uniref:NAD(P)H-binding protein n=1 Tax=Modestobacter versicolor TaxID=429133 RepID=UPI0034E03939
MTGSSGYIGSRLVVQLERAGHQVVATARDVTKLTDFDWPAAVAEVPLDVSDAGSCREAFAVAGDVEVAYFLVHSIGEGDFAAQDLDSARQFAAAAREAGVSRIVYLGGFVPQQEELSEHLESRADVGDALGEAGVELVWLRAAVVLGGGSTSYELVRHIADRVPVIPLPTWMQHPVSPIAVTDVLHYLVAAADRDQLPAGAYEVSNGERPTYADLIRAYAAEAGLRRLWLPVPPVPPRLVATIASWLTPLPRELAADLVMSLPNSMETHDDRIRGMVPDPHGGLVTSREALRRARQGSRTAGVGSSGDPAHRVRTDPDWSA